MGLGVPYAAHGTTAPSVLGKETRGGGSTRKPGASAGGRWGTGWLGRRLDAAEKSSTRAEREGRSCCVDCKGILPNKTPDT